MASTSKVFGELELAFTDQFTWCWDDKDTGGDLSGSFWHPVAPAGFKALGTIAISAWRAANLKTDRGGYEIKDYVVALCVKDAGKTPAGEKPALARPTGYENVWTDHGSGGKYNGAVWRPIPPAGYVAMGFVSPVNTYEQPSLDAVVCVREDLTFCANVTAGYHDKGTGAKKDLSLWKNTVPPQYVDNTPGATRVLIAPNTFAAHGSFAQPEILPEMRVLCLPMPVEKPKQPAFPELTSKDTPPQQTPEMAANAVWVPFTAINDTDKPISWKVANSPFYKIERKASWALVLHYNNTSEFPQKKTKTLITGVEKEQSSAFSINTGVSITTTLGVSTPVTSAEVSTTYSLELGFSNSTSLKELESQSVSWELYVLPYTAGAIWAATSTLQVVRADGTRVGPPLTFKADSSHVDQYPDKAPIAS
ncbi:Vps62-related protein [Streptomyces sp. 5.8]|uniref:Vps62-related protein n=1 Tax=Streptomyces sp. 5.8 TaxID=3406571 RepID=UPI003BB565C8